MILQFTPIQGGEPTDLRFTGGLTIERLLQSVVKPPYSRERVCLYVRRRENFQEDLYCWSPGCVPCVEAQPVGEKFMLKDRDQVALMPYTLGAVGMRAMHY